MGCAKPIVTLFSTLGSSGGKRSGREALICLDTVMGTLMFAFRNAARHAESISLTLSESCSESTLYKKRNIPSGGPRRIKPLSTKESFEKVSLIDITIFPLLGVKRNSESFETFSFVIKMFGL